MSYIVQRGLSNVNGTINIQAYQENMINHIKLQCECTMSQAKNITFNKIKHHAIIMQTRAFIRDQSNDILDWPSNCLELSLIETVWNLDGYQI